MNRYLSHKIELRPTPEQEFFIRKSVGTSRFVYNSLLAEFSERRDWSVKNARAFLMNELRVEFPWIWDVSADTPRTAISALDNAFTRLWKKQGGFPNFKKKGVKDSFVINDSKKFSIIDRELRIEKLKTRIKTREKLRLSGKPKNCTISYKEGKWFASIMVELGDTSPWKPVEDQQRKPSVGVDMGILSLAVLSDGTEFPTSQPLKANLRKLKKLQRKMARQVIGSSRREVTKRRIQKIHFKITCQRQATLHGLTDYLSRTYDRVVIEDLKPSNMMKNHRLARAIADVGFYEFRRQMEYKSRFRGVELVIADMWFPSSQLCSSCGHKQKMSLDKRTYVCGSCSYKIDRDLNA